MTVAQLASGAGASQGAACAWPPTGAQQARKPAGGFLDCPVDHLTLPWWMYQQGAMALGTLRVWLGTLELVEKRCCTAPEAPVHYRPEELRRLLRAPRLAPVTAGLQQLEELGLLAWSPQVIQFLPQAPVLQEALGQDGYQTLRAQLAPGLRWVPVPRRLLVWLAQEGQPGLIATACGVLLRCMRYKARQCVTGRGAACTHLSPMATQASSITSENTEGCADAMVAFFQPFQEERQDPEPTERGPTGAATREGQAKEHPPTPPVAPPDDEPVTDDDY